MWLQIVLSIILAAAALQFVFYAARHELVPVLQDRQDFTVRYPRLTLWIAVVLLALAGSLLLSMLIWHSADAANILVSALLAAAAIYALLLALVWRIEVKDRYLTCVSAVGVKRLVHYEDIEGARITRYLLIIRTPVKTFRMTNQVIYGEDLLRMLADHHVPITRDGGV
ncbi:MAG: hypothetical protein HDQ87_04350 [Clostridia bacterium]|nr:hypothetical protein [Clostridia bacterium]